MLPYNIRPKLNSKTLNFASNDKIGMYRILVPPGIRRYIACLVLLSGYKVMELQSKVVPKFNLFSNWKFVTVQVMFKWYIMTSKN